MRYRGIGGTGDYRAQDAGAQPAFAVLRRTKRSLDVALSRIGWPGVVGATLLAFCLAFYASTIVPGEAELARLQQDAVMLQEQLRRSEHLIRAGLNTPSGQLAAFYHALPTANSTPDWLEIIYLAAQEQNLKLEQGDYRTAREQVGRLTRYQITLPVKGPYLQIRQFVAAVLSQVPAASLDAIKFERQKIGESTIEAKIKLTLYLGNER